MNLYLLRSTLLAFAGFYALSACGSAPSATLDGAHQADAVAPQADAAPPGSMCGTNGTSAIHVHFSASSDALAADGGLWLGAICTDSSGTQHSTRVVALDPSTNDVTLSTLGPGQYIVRASAPTFEGVSSPGVVVGSNVDVTTAIYLPHGPALLGQVHAALGTDAGVASTSDAGGVARTFMGDAIRISDGGNPIATVQATLQPRDATSFDVVASVTALGTCAPSCRPVQIAGIELRLSRSGRPAALAVAPFEGGPYALAPDETGVTEWRTLPGSLDDPELTLDVLVFGSPDGSPDAGPVTDAGPATDAGRDG